MEWKQDSREEGEMTRGKGRGKEMRLTHSTVGSSDDGSALSADV